MSRQEIDARRQQFVDAFNDGDASEVARLYAEDGRILPPNAEIVQGRSAIEAFVKDFIQMGASLSLSLLAVHESPNLCAAVGRYELELRPQGAEPQTDSGKYVEVWTRQPDGSWLIVEDILNSSLPGS